MNDRQVCVVVGAGPGIGLAVARRFAQAGFAVALIARRPDALQDAAEDLRANGATVGVYAANVAEPTAVEAALARVEAEIGSIAVLHYNAYAGAAGLPTTLDPALLQRDLMVNVGGLLACVQAVLPNMRALQRGSILVTGGGLALWPSAAYASLAMGKAALRSLTFSLAEELAPAGIHVATVTVAGAVQAGTYFDPDRIADQFWALHSEPADTWTTEIIYREE